MSRAKCAYMGCDENAEFVNNPGLTHVCRRHAPTRAVDRHMYWRPILDTEAESEESA